MTRRALTLAEAADRLGVTRSSLRKYAWFPEPDVQIGDSIKGWFPETVDHAKENRPGQGARTDLIEAKAKPRRKRAAS